MHKFLLTLLLLPSLLHAQTKKSIAIADMDSIRDVTEPKISPDGKWVAYTVSSTNFKEDKTTSDIWMTSWDGNTTIQLTHTEDESETSPQWSSDNKYISFLRDDSDDEDQIWLLNRQGGEAVRLTDFPGGIEYYTWSPDGRKIALIADVGDTGKNIPGTETPLPIVIDRYYFKEDVTGYMTTSRHHLYVIDVATKDTQRIVDGNYEEDLPSWSRDGKMLAFVSKRAQKDYDRDNNYDVYVTDAKAHSAPRPITTNPGPDNEPDLGGAPVWSPDGKHIAYMQGGSLKLIYYATVHLAVADISGGDPKVLTANYDRNITQPRWSADGSEIYFLAEDDQNFDLDKISALGGDVQHVLDGRYTVYNLDISSDNKIAFLYTTPNQPEEVYVLDGNVKRQLSHQNDGWISRHQLATTKEFQSKSKDGTMISGFEVLPANYVQGKKYPTILQIHGGPTSQNQNEWAIDWQLYAANGYVVISMNPRGSTTKGEPFASAIYADWGNKDAEDVLSGVDEMVKEGVSDPDRLAVEGWSYGGILTNYVIAQDHRFKCAVSGASISNIFTGYGTDEYVREYEEELGAPWKNTETWEKLSFPFLHADRISTPTLFMCGDKDFNVPLHNVEQMYEALKSLGVETELVIYPGQYHEFTTPSYLRDRFQRRFAWFAKYMH